MRTLGIYCLIGLFVAGGVACGGGKTDEAKKAAETAQQAAKEIQQSTKAAGGGQGDLAKGMQEFAKSMEQMQRSPDGKAYEPVSFKVLEGILPDIPGWEKQKPTGETTASPIKFSQAETAYTKGGARIEVKIVDTAMSRLMTLPYRMMMAAGYSKETDSGYEKAASVAGNPGWEKWDSAAKHAEIGVIVGERFLVTAEGNDTDVKSVQEVAGKIDMAKLAGLK